MHHSIEQARPKSLVGVVAMLVVAFWAHAVGAHPADEAFCKALVGNGSEEIQVVPYDVVLDDEAKAIQTRVAKPDGWLTANDIRGVYRVDIDNDGEIDNVVLSAGGTAQFARLAAFGAQWQRKSFEMVGYEPDDLAPGWVETGSVYRFKGRTYTGSTSTSSRELVYASVVDQGLDRLICKFGYETTPQESVVIGRGDGVCEAVLHGDVQYIELSEWRGLRSDALCFESNGPDCARPTGQAGLLDIDNDGVNERVVSMQVSWGGGRGCDFDFLAIPEPDGGQLKRDGNGKLLLDATATWGEACSGAVSKPFRYDGAVYIENKYPPESLSEYHHVVRIADGRVEKVCTFSVARKRFIVQAPSTAEETTPPNDGQ